MHHDQQLAPSALFPLLDHLSQGVVLLDQKNQIIFSNHAAKSILEISQEGLPNDFILNEQSLQQLIYRSKSLEIKKINTAEGQYLLIQDLSQIKELRLAANRSDRLKEIGGMTALLAHEIRNPLGGIKGFASLLHRDLKERPELQQMASFILDGTEHLNRLLTHILNFAHPFQTQIKPYDLVVLIQDIETHIRADASLSKNLHFKFNTLLDFFILPIDHQLLRSALLNLIINGIQAMPEGGTLTVTLDKQDDRALIQISDTGSGIAKENLQKLFTKFFTTKPEGNGFGLIEVNQVVQAHQGHIELETALDKGTSFTINLPVHHAY